MAYADAVLADSPLGYWKLDEASGTTCADSSGNGRDLIYGGTPSFRNSGPPIVGGVSYAVGLDGVNGEGATAGYASWMLPTSFSLECWVRSTASAGYPAIFGVANGRADSGQFVLYIRSGTIKATFTNTFAASSEVTTGSGMTDGNWRHVVVTHDSVSGSFILYINGSSVASNSRTGTPQSVSQPISIGGCGSTVDSNWFSGDIAHCAYYGAALSPARVLAHYEAAAGIALAGGAAASASATGNLTETGSGLSGVASAASAATGAVKMAQTLVADAIARASALGHMPTPGPGFGCWTRGAWPFARYIGRAISFGYRPYYDDAGALAGAAQAVSTATGNLALTVIGLALRTFRTLRSLWTRLTDRSLLASGSLGAGIALNSFRGDQRQLLPLGDGHRNIFAAVGNLVCRDVNYLELHSSHLILKGRVEMSWMRAGAAAPLRPAVAGR